MRVIIAIKFPSFTQHARVRWIRFQSSVLTFSADGAIVARRSITVFASWAGATTEADGTEAKHVARFITDRVATFAIFNIFQGSVVALAGITSRTRA